MSIMQTSRNKRGWAASILGLIVGIALLGAVSVPGAWAGSGRSGGAIAPANGDDEFTVTQVDAPDPVSSGNLVSYVVTVSAEDDLPGEDVDSVLLTDTLPDGSTFVSADPTQGTCSQSEGVVSCDLGELGEGSSATVSIVAQVPVVEAETVITNTATAEEQDDAPADGGSSSTESTTVLPLDQDLTVGFVPDAGLVLNTDLGTGATEDNPTTTRMTVPAGRSGVASIAEVEGVPTDCPAPFTCFGQRIDLSAPEVYGAPRLRITFTFDASSLPSGLLLSEVQIFRNGVLVPACQSPNYADPCVQRKRFIAGGDLRVWVCSSETSGWRGGQ